MFVMRERDCGRKICCPQNTNFEAVPFYGSSQTGLFILDS
jgi:hypothetical protein